MHWACASEDWNLLCRAQPRPVNLLTTQITAIAAESKDCVRGQLPMTLSYAGLGSTALACPIESSGCRGEPAWAASQTLGSAGTAAACVCQLPITLSYAPSVCSPSARLPPHALQGSPERNVRPMGGGLAWVQTAAHPQPLLEQCRCKTTSNLSRARWKH